MKIGIGLVLILTAVWGILDATGVAAPIASAVGNIYIAQIMIGLVLVVFILRSLIKKRVPLAVGLASVLFMVAEPNIAYACGYASGNIINNWLMLGLTALLCVGLWLVLPRRKSSKNAVGNTIGGTVGKKIGSHNIGGTVYIDSGSFENEVIENNMSNTVVRFENPDLYLGNGTLVLDNNMGSVQIFVPEAWRIEMRVENNLGSVPVYPHDDGDGPLLVIAGDNNMGSVGITRV
ncbi:MAG: hypothetical protein IKV35_04485 [Clostridia bacterium]|nr:hypothetical protein [Clostridia bacterium]